MSPLVQSAVVGFAGGIVAAVAYALCKALIDKVIEIARSFFSQTNHMHPKPIRNASVLTLKE